MKTFIMDAAELYYIKDLKSKRWSGVRWSREVRETMALERFVDSMHIVILKVVIKCMGRRAKK